MISCNKCGTLNRDGSKFCNNCGERLRPAPGGSAMPANGIICPKCGTLNQVENVFCSNCGTHLVRLSESGQPDQSSAPPPIKGLSLPTKSASPTSTDATPDESAGPVDTTPPSDDAMPDWLRNLRSAASSAEPADIEEPVAPESAEESNAAGEAAASQAEVPDWLARLRTAPPEPEEGEMPGEGISPDPAPDWIRALQQQPPDQPAPASPAQQMPEPGEIVEPSTPFESPAAPATGTDLPSWIEQLPTDAESEEPNPLETDRTLASRLSAEAPAAITPSSENAPDEDMTIASADEFATELASAGSAPASTDETPAEIESDEIPDWLRMAAGAGENLPPEQSPSAAGQPQAGEPSTAQAAAQAQEPPRAEPTQATEPAPAPATSGQLPPWLAGLRPEGVEEQPAGLDTTGTRTGFEIEPAETAGPLAGLRGVLPLAVAVAEPHHSTKPAQAVEQENAAHIFDAILAEPVPEHEVPVTGVKRRRMGFQPWIYLLLALAVLVPFLLPVSLAGSFLSISNVPPAALHDLIEGLTAGSTVLVSFDYDPSMTGEMDLVANAIVRDLVRRKVKIIAVSTLETGPQIAQRVLDRAAATGQNYSYGSEYVNLGYLPGHEAGLAQLATIGLPADNRDFVQGRSLEQFSALASVKRLQDTQLIVEFAGSDETLKSWMEQVQPRAGVRIAAGVSAGVEPKARAYLGAGQLAAMTSGLLGAARYEILSRAEGLAVTSVDAQSIAMVLLVLLVIAGNVVFWAFRPRGKA